MRRLGGLIKCRNGSEPMRRLRCTQRTHLMDSQGCPLSSCDHGGCTTTSRDRDSVITGFDVEHGCAVDGMQFGRHPRRTFAPKHAAHRGADPVRSVLPALGKAADGRPVLVVPWVASTGDDGRGFDLVKDEDDLARAAVAEALQRVLSEPWRALNACFLGTPEVVLRLRAKVANGFQVDGQGARMFAGGWCLFTPAPCAPPVVRQCAAPSRARPGVPAGPRRHSWPRAATRSGQCRQPSSQHQPARATSAVAPPAPR